MDNLRDQIIALANELQGEEDDNELGFIDNPGGNGDTEFVFLNRTEYNHGHITDDEGEAVPIPGDAMAGYVDDVYYEFRESDQFGLTQKLRVVLNCEGYRIMMESGFFTNTGKSLLTNLAHVQDRGALIAIEPSLPDNPQDSPNVLFTEIYENGEMITDTNGDWPQDDQEVIDLFNYVREDVFGFEPQETQPQLPDRSLFGADGTGDAPDRRSSDRQAGDQHRESDRPASRGKGARSRSRRRSA